MTEDRLTEVIPAMVLDASASARWQWGRNSYEKATGDWSVKFGNEYHTAWFLRGYYFKLIEGRIVDWRGKLLRKTIGSSTPVVHDSPLARAKTLRRGGGDTAAGLNGLNEKRRNAKYEAIEKALRESAAARPNSHEEVFRLLEGRKVPIPNSEPFKSAGGWLKGFQRNSHSARAWLSKEWTGLGLPAFPRGPKKN